MGLNQNSRLTTFLSKGLYEKICTDLFSHQIFNEGDHLGSSYYHVRQFLNRNRTEYWTVRCNPSISIKGRMRKWGHPDLCIFYQYQPQYVIELKLFKENWTESTLNAELEKMKAFKARNPTVKNCILLYVYDSDASRRELNSYWRRKEGLQGFYEIPINVRKHARSGWYRDYYHAWKNQSQNLLEKMVSP